MARKRAATKTKKSAAKAQKDLTPKKNPKGGAPKGSKLWAT
jgi:hypothetical protein